MEKIEKFDSGSQERELTEAEKVLGSMPEFSQYNMIATINNVTKEKIKPDMDVSAVKDFLSELNGAILGIDKSEIMEYGEVVGAAVSGSADYVAPNRLVRDEVAANYLDAINSEEDINKRAELAYYAIINMHLFKDGNGRTARAVYLILKHGDINEDDAAFLQHGKNEKGNGIFEENNSIKSAEMLNFQATEKVLFDELENGALPEWVKEFAKENGAYSIHTYWQPEQDELQEKGLSEDERKILHDIFQDDILAGYATSELLSLEDKEDVLRANIIESSPGLRDYNRITFTHNKGRQEKYNSVFGSMSAERYRKLIDIYNDLKIKENKKIIEIIKNG